MEMGRSVRRTLRGSLGFIGLGAAAFALAASLSARVYAEEPSGVVDATVPEAGDETTGFAANYYSIFYGPGFKGTGDYQPTLSGVPDPNKPVLMKNFIDLGYGVTDSITLAVDAYWIWVPVMGQDLQMQDPILKIADSSIYHNDYGVNVYVDLRAHLPVTSDSRANDLRAGFQSVQVALWKVGKSDLTLGIYGSERTNFFGPQGNGNDLELYVGPNASYRLTDNFSLTALYDQNWVHVYGAPAWLFTGNGSDVEPGFEWDITRSVSINPYLNFLTGGPLAAKNTSFGFIFNWRMI